MAVKKSAAAKKDAEKLQNSTAKGTSAARAKAPVKPETKPAVAKKTPAKKAAPAAPVASVKPAAKKAAAKKPVAETNAAETKKLPAANVSGKAKPEVKKSGKKGAAKNESAEQPRFTLLPVIDMDMKKPEAKKTAKKGETVACVISGANMDFDRIRFVCEVNEACEQRKALS